MTWLEDLKSFQKLLETEDYAGASALVPSLLSESPPDDSSDSSIRPAILKGYTRCLLELEDFTKLKEVLEQQQQSSHHLSSELESVYRYTLYRLRNFTTLEATASASTAFEKHLRAQMLYNLSKTEDSFQIYQELLDECQDVEEREQLLVNLTASQLAQAVPFVRTSRSDEMMVVQEFLDSTASASASSVYPLDLVNNYATLLLLEGDASAAKLLRSALEHAQDASDREIIEYNLDWSVHFHSGTTKSPSSKPLYLNPHLQSVQLCSSGSVPAGVTKIKFTALQTRMALYNTAVSHLCENKLSECQKVCKEILAGRVDIWWTSRVAVLQAYGDKSKGPELLQNKLVQVKKLDESPLRDAAWLYLEVHRVQMMEEMLDASKLPPSLQSSNGVLATLVRQQRDPASIQLSLTQQADTAMSAKDYPLAAQLCQQLYDQSHDPIARARLVAALSHVDPQQALDTWMIHQQQQQQQAELTKSLIEEVNGAELEQQELPRLKTSRPTTLQETKPSKSHESVMRRRAKKRDEYLKQLEQKGLYRNDRPTKPDPERWLPKMERSYGRKKKGKTHKGAQGGVSEKEASKLDIAARQNADASDILSSTPSTAHIVASSESAIGGRKGGRRR